MARSKRPTKPAPRGSSYLVTGVEEEVFASRPKLGENRSKSARPKSKPATPAPKPADGELREIVVDTALLESIGIRDAVRQKLTVPPPADTRIEARARTAVRELARCGPGEEDATIKYLTGLGPGAIGFVAHVFPGPLWFDRHSAHGNPPGGSKVSGMAKALVSFGRAATPHVAVLLEADHTDVRYYAVLVAEDIRDPDLLLPLAQRIFDPDPQISRIAVRAMVPLRRHADMGLVRAALTQAATGSTTHVEYRLRAIHAVAELRDVEFVPVLIDLVEAKEPSLATAAEAALTRLTCHSAGRSSRKWLAWHKRHKGVPRIDWLVEGLESGDEAMRATAGREVVLETGQDFGFLAEAPKKERAAVVKRYRKWSRGTGDG